MQATKRRVMCWWLDVIDCLIDLRGVRNATDRVNFWAGDKVLYGVAQHREVLGESTGEVEVGGRDIWGPCGQGLEMSAGGPWEALGGQPDAA